MSSIDLPRLTTGERLATGAATALLAFTSLWRLGVPEWLPDELVYAEAGRALVSGGELLNPEHPPLGKLLFGLGQRLTGDHVNGTRLVSVAAAFAIGALLFTFLRRTLDGRVAVTALLAWAVVPHAGAMGGALGQVQRLDRFGMLDPLATALAMGAVVVGWKWADANGGISARGWRAPLLTGLLGGLAAGVKASGVLVLPAIAAWVLWQRRDAWRSAMVGIGTAVAGSVAGLALAHAWLGTDALGALGDMLAFQRGHASAGHIVTVAGQTTASPPWWSHLWFHQRDEDLGYVLALYASAALAPWMARGRDERQRRVVWYLVAVGAFVLAAFTVTPVKLPFYRYAWLPFVIALAAVTLAELPGRWVSGTYPTPRSGTSSPPSPWLRGMRVLLLAGPLVVVGSSTVFGIATVQTAGYPLVAQRLQAAGLADGEPVVLRGRPRLLRAYAPEVHLVDGLPARAVVLEDSITSRFPDPLLDAVVDDPAWQCDVDDGLTLCLLR